MLATPDNMIVFYKKTEDNFKNLVLPHADVIILDLPEDKTEAMSVFTTFNNSQPVNCLILCFFRPSKKKKHSTLSNINCIEQCGFNLIDIVTVSYDEAMYPIGDALISRSEIAFLISKKNTLNYSATSWFHESYGNATNLWDVSKIKGLELSTSCSKLKHFTCELGYLLTQLASPLICRRMIYISNNINYALAEFSYLRDIQICIVSEDEKDFEKFNKGYEKHLNKFKSHLLNNHGLSKKG